MGKHHAQPRIKVWVKRVADKRSPATAPTIVTGAVAIVVALGLSGNAMTVDFADSPDSPPQVRSSRPPLTLAPGAAGGRTELVAKVTPRPKPSRVHRSRTVESSPSAPVRDRATYAPPSVRPIPRPTPTPAPVRSSATAEPADVPTTEPAAEPTCEWDR